MTPPREPFFIDDAVRALLDPRAPATDPAVRAIQVAMTGFGYNFYDARNVARANDQIVRERASDALGEASASLGRLERAYRTSAFPAASREQPLPPPGALALVRAVDERRRRCEALGSALHAAETPATDAIWFRFRDEASLLARLVACDVELATGAARVRDAAMSLDAATLEAASFATLDAELDGLERSVSRRGALLKGG